jgi:16S rRNA processing protein RimM
VGEEVLLEVARVAKPHGTRGEVLVKPITNNEQRFREGSRLVTAAGRELSVRQARAFKGGYIVAFSEVRGREEAEALRGEALYARAPVDPEDPEALYIHQLGGARVVDSSGRTLGRVVAMELNPAHDLLVLDTDVMVPMPFVKGLGRDAEGRVVYVDAPEGLADVNKKPSRPPVPPKRRRPGRGAADR